MKYAKNGIRIAAALLSALFLPKMIGNKKAEAISTGLIISAGIGIAKDALGISTDMLGEGNTLDYLMGASYDDSLNTPMIGSGMFDQSAQLTMTGLNLSGLNLSGDEVISADSADF